MQWEQDLFFFFFSQSYEIGRMNEKYAPGSEIMVRRCLTIFGTNCGHGEKYILNVTSPLTIGQGFEAPGHRLFRVGLSEVSGKGS